MTVLQSTPTMTAASSAPIPVWPRRISSAAAVLVLCALATLAVQASAWSFVADDAYISFRYARNLVAYGELTFNPGLEPIERVEGYTNFLWVLLLAFGDLLGVAPHALAPVLTACGSLASLVALVFLVRLLRARSEARHWDTLVAKDVMPALLLAAIPEFSVWAGGGLETSVAAFLSISAMVAFLADRWRAAALLAALAGLTRMDALLPIAAFGIGCLVDAWRHRLGVSAIPWPSQSTLRRLALAAVVFVGPLLAHLLWRRAYYGQWLPNTWTVKAHGELLRGTWGVSYVGAWLDSLHVMWLMPLGLWIRSRHLPLVLPVLAVSSYAWWVGGDFMAYGRFLLPATMSIVALTSWLLIDAAGTLGRWIGPRLAAIGPMATAVLLTVGLAAESRTRWKRDRATATGWLDGKWEGVTAMHRFARVRIAAGTWMRQHLPPTTLLSVGAAGALPYASGLPAIDTYGLVDPWIANHVRPMSRGGRPGHQLYAPHEYIERRDPDLMCHIGYHGARPPARTGIAARYRATHVWACIDLGTIADPTAPDGELAAGSYCCLRPRDRVVGPFGDRS